MTFDEKRTEVARRLVCRLESRMDDFLKFTGDLGEDNYGYLDGLHYECKRVDETLTALGIGAYLDKELPIAAD